MTALLSPPPATPRPQPLSELCNFFPRQREALRAVERHTFTLYGGAAGGGKSRFLRWLAVILLIRWAKRGFRGVRVGLFSVDYPTLHDRQLSKIRAEFPEWLGSFNESAREFRLAPHYGGGVICFRNLDDPGKYKSAEFAAILVDELTESELSMFDQLRWRRRWPGIHDTRFVGATNPGGVGHDWCKRIWIDRDFPEELRGREGEFAYVKATAVDNPHNSPSYLRELDSLPDAMRKMLRDGNWDTFLGQFFGEFNRETHVCRPFAIPAWWRRWIANDPGTTDPGVWFKLAADQLGNVYVYGEFTFRPVDNVGIPHAKQAEAVAQSLVIDGQFGRKEREPIDFAVAGMDAFNKNINTGKSLINYYDEGGLPASWFLQPDHGPGCRARGAATVRHYLASVKQGEVEQPRLRIFDTCAELIRTLPSLPHDPNQPDAVLECGIDHWFDALRYGLQAWHAKRSQHPVGSRFEAGSAGQILDHEEVLGKDEGPGKIVRTG